MSLFKTAQIPLGPTWKDMQLFGERKDYIIQ